MQMKTNDEFSIRAEVTSSQIGNIIVEKGRFQKIIPAVLFTSQEARRLLEVVDRVETNNRAYAV